MRYFGGRKFQLLSKACLRHAPHFTHTFQSLSQTGNAWRSLDCSVWVGRHSRELEFAAVEDAAQTVILTVKPLAHVAQAVGYLAEHVLRLTLTGNIRRNAWAQNGTEPLVKLDRDRCICPDDIGEVFEPTFDFGTTISRGGLRVTSSEGCEGWIHSREISLARRGCQWQRTGVRRVLPVCALVSIGESMINAPRAPERYTTGSPRVQIVAGRTRRHFVTRQ